MALAKTILLQNIQRSANALGAIDTDGFVTGLIGRDQAEAVLLVCDACLANIASAQRNGIEGSEQIAIILCGREEPQVLMLSQCQAWCEKVKTLASECVYRFRIHQALLQANVWVSDLREPGGLSGEQATFAAETGSILLQILQDALDAGVSEGMTIELNNTYLTLAQVRQVGLYVASAGISRNKNIKTVPS